MVETYFHIIHTLPMWQHSEYVNCRICINILTYILTFWNKQNKNVDSNISSIYTILCLFHIDWDGEKNIPDRKTFKQICDQQIKTLLQACVARYMLGCYTIELLHTITKKPISIKGLLINTIYKCLQNAYLFDRFICLEPHYLRSSNDDITHLSMSVQSTMDTRDQVIIVWIRTSDVRIVSFPRSLEITKEKP